MKRLFIYLSSIILLLGSALFVGCSEDATPSIYDSIKPSDKLPVDRYYNFNEKSVPPEKPYGITVDNLGFVYVSLNGLGIKKITGDSLTVFAPKGPESFFKAMTFGSDGLIYAVRGGIKGIYKITLNTIPAAFVASSQGISDNVNDVEFDNSKNVIWAGGNTGIIYRITLDKNVKKFINLSGNINALKITSNFLYVALSDTNEQEVVWKYPVVSSDSLGAGELFFNYTEKIDPLGKIIDIAISEDGSLYIFSNIQWTNPSINFGEIHRVNSSNSYEELYNGLISGSFYSFCWGLDQNAYFSNIIVGANTDVYKIDMKKNKAQ
ncbi:MAG: hypothetical protein IPH97_09645 [Ignavibacteriales bacterium]|nr:hypothetical protein [Ignavibacteriales bacterium]